MYRTTDKQTEQSTDLKSFTAVCQSAVPYGANDIFDTYASPH